MMSYVTNSNLLSLDLFPNDQRSISSPQQTAVRSIKFAGLAYLVSKVAEVASLLLTGLSHQIMINNALGFSLGAFAAVNMMCYVMCSSDRNGVVEITAMTTSCLAIPMIFDLIAYGNGGYGLYGMIATAVVTPIAVGVGLLGYVAFQGAKEKLS